MFSVTPAVCNCVERSEVWCRAHAGLFPTQECHPYDIQLPVVRPVSRISSVESTPGATLC